MRVSLVLPLVLLAACGPATAADSDWRLRGGVAALAQPKYVGADKQRLLAAPLIEARWRKQVFLGSLRGLGYEAELGEGASVSAALAVDTHQRRRKDGLRVQALDEIKLAPALRLGAELALGPVFVNAVSSTRLGKDSKPGGRGSSVELEAGYGLLPAPGLALAFGVSAKLMDAKLGQALLGINSAQAAASGLRPHQVGAGLHSLGVFGQASYQLGADWQLFAKLGVASLRGDAAGSPLVQRKNQPTLAIAASRSF